MKQVVLNISLLAGIVSITSLWSAQAPYYSSWARMEHMYEANALALQARNTEREGVITKHLMSLGVHSQKDITDQIKGLQLTENLSARYLKIYADTERNTSDLNGYLGALKTIGQPGTPHALATYRAYYDVVMGKALKLESAWSTALNMPSATLDCMREEHKNLQAWAQNATCEQLHTAYHQERDSLRNACEYIKKWYLLRKQAIELTLCAAYLGILDGQECMHVSSPELSSTLTKGDHYAKCVAAQGNASLGAHIHFTLPLDIAQPTQDKEAAHQIAQDIIHMWDE